MGTCYASRTKLAALTIHDLFAMLVYDMATCTCIHLMSRTHLEKTTMYPKTFKMGTTSSSSTDSQSRKMSLTPRFYNQVDWTSDVTDPRQLPVGVRIKYFHEKKDDHGNAKCVVCIAYVWECKSRKLYFAGSIWNADPHVPKASKDAEVNETTSTLFTKKIRALVRSTALDRLKNMPNMYVVPEKDPESKKRLVPFAKIARRKLGTMGCCNKALERPGENKST